MDHPQIVSDGPITYQPRFYLRALTTESATLLASRPVAIVINRGRSAQH